jgi:HprK-related kinase B
MITEHPTRLDRLMHAIAEHHPMRARTDLALGELGVLVESNNEALCQSISDYFRSYRTRPHATDLRIVAIEAKEPELNIFFRDWERDPGKTGRKEEFADIEGGRVVRKVRTGMQFLIGPDVTLAVGACLRNQNQIINLVNTRYISERLREGFVLCHAAGVARGGRGIGLCGVSGAGKSTLALQLISRGAAFVSNDRLLVRKQSDAFAMAGVPKLPRVNPGTIVSNPDLHVLLGEERRAELLRMPLKDLWQLEEKYDVDIERIYGADRMRLSAQLRALVVLTWSPGQGGEVSVRRAKLGDRPDLVPLLAKHPGPFHRDEVPGMAGSSSVHALDPKPYLDQLGELPVVELSGTANFPRAAELCEELLA